MAGGGEAGRLSGRGGDVNTLNYKKPCKTLVKLVVYLKIDSQKKVLTPTLFRIRKLKCPWGQAALRAALSEFGRAGGREGNPMDPYGFRKTLIKRCKNEHF